MKKIDLKLDSVRAQYGTLFRPDNFISGPYSAGNNFAKGRYTDGSDLVDSVMDVVRKEAEFCDTLQGFQFCHSMGGGTGSGITTLILEKIREEFPDRIVSMYSMFPSPKVSDTVVEPYNTVLAMRYLIEMADQVFCLDNEALFNICVRKLKLTTPTYQDLNHLVSIPMSGTTVSLRFPGQMNADMRKMATNLVPFPRLHFFAISSAPLITKTSRTCQQLSFPELTAQIFDTRNMMTSCDFMNGRFLTASVIFQGQGPKEVEQLCTPTKEKSKLFVEWIPDSIKKISCDISPTRQSMAVTLIGNHTSVQEVFCRIHDVYRMMCKRKAFFLWYTGEGMEESEFDDANANMTDLISEYQQYQQDTLDDEEPLSSIS